MNGNGPDWLFVITVAGTFAMLILLLMYAMLRIYV